MEKLLSQSFCVGNGSIEHNLRKLKGKGIRQNGILSRRKWNDVILDRSLDEVLHELVDTRLAEYNEKQIRTRHSNLCKSFDEWKQAVCFTRKGKQKQLYSEIIIQVGDRYTGCPYEYETDKDGNILAEDGRPIPPWDTRKKPKLKDGKETPSARQKLWKKIHRKVFAEFCQANPCFVPTTAVTHNDEFGGSHLHINGIFVSQTRNGLGIGISKSRALAQQLEAEGIVCDRDSRTKNAVATWTAIWRYEKLPKILKENFDIDRKDMKCAGRAKLDIDQHKDFADARSEFLTEYADGLREWEDDLNAKASLLETKADSLDCIAKKQDENARKLATAVSEVKSKETVLKSREKQLQDKVAKTLKLEAELKQKQLANEIKERELGVKEATANEWKKKLSILKQVFPQTYKRVCETYKGMTNQK